MRNVSSAQQSVDVSELEAFKRIGFQVDMDSLTRDGIPVVRVWDNKMPKEGIEGAGFPILKNAKHAEIFHAEKEIGGYNHHSSLFHYEGQLFGSWSNQRFTEDAPGQRVLFSRTAVGAEKWAEWAELFPSPVPMRPHDTAGYFLAAAGWSVVHGKLYALAWMAEFNGFEDANGNFFSSYDPQHPFQVVKHIGHVARSVSKSGKLGPVFSLGFDVRNLSKTSYQILPANNPKFASIALAIEKSRLNRGSLNFDGNKLVPVPVGTARLNEPVFYRIGKEVLISLWRDDRFSHRKFISISENNGKTWTKAWPTNIPDSPSLSAITQAGEGQLMLVGNQCAFAFDNPDAPSHYNRDPLTIALSKDGGRSFSSVYALRTGGHQLRVPDVFYRGGGAQYPSIVVVNKRLYVMFSSGKEDIWCSSISLDEMDEFK